MAPTCPACSTAACALFSNLQRQQIFQRLSLLLILAGLGLGPLLRADTSSTSLSAVDEKWRHYTSPHFELYSHDADRPSREILYNLEILRGVFLERLKLEVRLQVPVTVFCFRSKGEFQSYAPKVFDNQSDLAGFHLFQADRAIISLAPSEDDNSARETVFHEFVHHLFRISERDPSLWYNEGTAEVLASMKVDGKRVQIGTHHVNRTLYLRQENLLPLDQLFAATPASGAYTKEEHTGVFYAQSWALLHYWQFGDSGFSKEAVNRFLTVAADRQNAGKTDLRALFQSCFNCDYPEMQRRLERYIHTGSYRSGFEPLPKLEAPASYAVRPVDANEITVRLAELAVRVRQPGSGKLVLLNAISGRPTDPRPLEVLGTAAVLEEDELIARERWEQAIAAGSKNPAVIRELALMEGRRWFGQFDDSYHPPTDLVERLRRRLLKSIETEPRQGAAYAMLASVEACAESPNAKNINLVIAQLPSMSDKKRALIGLSLVMLRVGRPETALTMLDFLDTLSLDAAEARAKADLRTRLQTDFPAIAKKTDAKENAQTIAPPPNTPSLKRPSVALPDDL